MNDSLRGTFELECQIVLSNFKDTPLPDIFSYRGWESLASIWGIAYSHHTRMFYVNINEYIPREFSDSMYRLAFVVTTHLIFQMPYIRKFQRITPPVVLDVPTLSLAKCKIIVCTLYRRLSSYKVYIPLIDVIKLAWLIGTFEMHYILSYFPPHPSWLRSWLIHPLCPHNERDWHWQIYFLYYVIPHFSCLCQQFVIPYYHFLDPSTAVGLISNMNSLFFIGLHLSTEPSGSDMWAILPL